MPWSVCIMITIIGLSCSTCKGLSSHEAARGHATAKCKLLLFLDIITTNNASSSLSRTTHIR